MGSSSFKSLALEKRSGSEETFCLSLRKVREVEGHLLIRGSLIGSDRMVTVVTPSWWLEDYVEDLRKVCFGKESEGAVLVFAGCETGESDVRVPSAYSVVTRSAHERYHILNGEEELARISPAVRGHDGSLSRSLEWIEPSGTRQVETREEAFRAIGICMDREGPGTPGALVRAVDYHGDAMAMTILRERDPLQDRYLPPESSLTRFMRSDSVYVHGLDMNLDPRLFFEAMSMQRFAGSVWEVMPLRSLSLPADMDGPDISMDFRFSGNEPETGFRKSVIGIGFDEDGAPEVRAAVALDPDVFPHSLVPSEVIQPKSRPEAERKDAPRRTRAEADMKSEGECQPQVAVQEERASATEEVEVEAAAPDRGEQEQREAEATPRHAAGEDPSPVESHPVPQSREAGSEGADAAVHPDDLLPRADGAPAPEDADDTISIDDVFDSLGTAGEPFPSAREGSSPAVTRSSPEPREEVHAQRAGEAEEDVVDIMAIPSVEDDVVNIMVLPSDPEPQESKTEDENELSSDELDELKNAYSEITRFAS